MSKRLKITLIVLAITLPYLVVGIYSLNKFLARPKVIISTGSKGGLYSTLGSALVPILNKSFEGKMTFEARASKGSNENVERLESGEAQLAFAQDGLDSGGKVKALLRLFKSPLHIVVSKNAKVTSIIDLSNRVGGRKPVAFLGASGSGTRTIAELIIKQYGLSGTDFEIVADNWSFQDASEAVRKGKIDVAFFLVGIGSEALNSLAEDGRFTLLGIDRVQGITTKYPFLEEVKIPQGTYAASFKFPDREINTVATREILICNSNLSEHTAYRIVEGILTNINELVLKFPLITQISRLEPERSFYYPLHPGAMSFYKNLDTPSAIPWSVVTGLVGYTFSLVPAIRIWIRKRRVNHLIQRLDRIVADMQKVEERLPASESERYRMAFNAIQEESIKLYTKGRISSDAYDLVKEYLRVYSAQLNQMVEPQKLVVDTA